MNLKEVAKIKDDSLVGGQFTIGSDTYTIKKVEPMGQGFIYHVVGGKQFNSKVLEKNDIAIVPKERAARVGKPWSEERQRLTKKEFERRVREMGTPSEGEFDHSDFYDLASGLYNTDSDVKKYVKITQQLSGNDAIEYIQNMMENFAG